MKLTMLGTGNALVTECYNTCFVVEDRCICRIPVQDALSFSEFTRFVLLHFYGIKLEREKYWLEKESTITTLERKMLHLSWDK